MSVRHASGDLAGVNVLGSVQGAWATKPVASSAVSKPASTNWLANHQGMYLGGNGVASI